MKTALDRGKGGREVHKKVVWDRGKVLRASEHEDGVG
jgi:hypothetical protein